MPKLKRTEKEKQARGGAEFIESLDRGLRVLQSFGIERRPMTLSDIAKTASLPRATVRRILMTLPSWMCTWSSTRAADGDEAPTRRSAAP